MKGKLDRLSAASTSHRCLQLNTGTQHLVRQLGLGKSREKGKLDRLQQ